MRNVTRLKPLDQAGHKGGLPDAAFAAFGKDHAAGWLGNGLDNGGHGGLLLPRFRFPLSLFFSIKLEPGLLFGGGRRLFPDGPKRLWEIGADRRRSRIRSDQ